MIQFSKWLSVPLHLSYIHYSNGTHSMWWRCQWWCIYTHTRTDFRSQKLALLSVLRQKPFNFSSHNNLGIDQHSQVVYIQLLLHLNSRSCYIATTVHRPDSQNSTLPSSDEEPSGSLTAPSQQVKFLEQWKVMLISWLDLGRFKLDALILLSLWGGLAESIYSKHRQDKFLEIKLSTKRTLIINEHRNNWKICTPADHDC